MLEKEIEKTLVNKIKSMDGLCLKMNSLSMTGIPDRLILMPSGKMGFVELKKKGIKPRPLQIKRIKTLKQLGYKCFVIDDKNQIGDVLDEIRAT